MFPNTCPAMYGVSGGLFRTVMENNDNTTEYIRLLRGSGYRGVIQLVSLTLEQGRQRRTVQFDFREKIRPQVETLCRESASALSPPALVRIETLQQPAERLEYLNLVWQTDVAQPDLPEQPASSNGRLTSDPYWRPIRTHIRNGMIFAPGVTMVIRNSKGEIVLVKRRDDGEWSIPAGSREIGESIGETATHEVYEETGLTVRLTRLCALQSGTEMEWTYPNGHETSFLSFKFEAEVTSGDLHVADEENTDARWVEEKEALRLMSLRWRRQFSLIQSSVPGRLSLD